MTSLAREAFLSGLAAFQESLDEPRVLGKDDVGLFLRKGLTVAAYNLLETFVSSRLDELAGHVNGGVSQFLDLPEKLQRRAIVNSIQVGKSQISRAGIDLRELRTFSESLGKSLSAVNASLKISSLTWKWQGSNMGVDDYHAALRYFHVKNPWESVRLLAARLSFPTVDYLGDPIDQKQDLKELLMERHRSAHEPSTSVTALWLRTVPERILKYAVTFDLLASVAANLLRVGDSQMLSNEEYVDSKLISVRFVKARAKGFAEMLEGNTRASRVGDSLPTLLAAASTRCTQQQVLIEQSITGMTVTWSIPSVG